MSWHKSSRSVGVNCVEVWERSSYSMSNGQCVEFLKSSHSAAENCTEVAQVPDEVWVRDSKMAPKRGFEGPEGPHLVISLDAWQAFIDGVKLGMV